MLRGWTGKNWKGYYCFCCFGILLLSNIIFVKYCCCHSTILHDHDHDHSKHLTGLPSIQLRQRVPAVVDTQERSQPGVSLSSSSPSSLLSSSSLSPSSSSSLSSSSPHHHRRRQHHRHHHIFIWSAMMIISIIPNTTCIDCSNMNCQNLLRSQSL